MPIALAAGLALLVARPIISSSPSQRLKGTAAPALSAQVMVADGAALEPLARGRVYPQTAELFFTYTLSDDAHIYLGRVGVDGSVEAFYPPLGVADAPHAAGTWALTAGGTVQGYSLRGLASRQRFVVIASGEPLSGNALRAAIEQAVRAGAIEVEVEAP